MGKSDQNQSICLHLDSISNNMHLGTCYTYITSDKQRNNVNGQTILNNNVISAKPGQNLYTRPHLRDSDKCESDTFYT